MNEIKVTILIPVLNMNTVSRAIDSVLTQTYPNIELVVLDGGSSDGTLETLKQYGNAIDILISEPDDGPSFAMARNIDRVTGDYVTMLGADDWYCDNNSVAEAVDAIKKSCADVVFGDCNFVYPDGSTIRKTASNSGLENLIFYNSLFTVASFVKREYLSWYYREYWDQYKERISISTDHFLWILLYHKGCEFEHICSKNAITNFSTMGRSNNNIYKGCIEGEIILREVLHENENILKKYLGLYSKYFAARTFFLYKGVVEDVELITTVKEYLPDNDYVIWGLGDMGRTFLDILLFCGIKPRFIIDNNPNMYGKRIMEIDVCSAEKLTMLANATVVISTFANEAKIRKQIAAMSVDSSIRVISYADMAYKIQKKFGKEILNSELNTY